MIAITVDMTPNTVPDLAKTSLMIKTSIAIKARNPKIRKGSKYKMMVQSGPTVIRNRSFSNNIINLPYLLRWEC